jgi:hypothetical protein
LSSRSTMAFTVVLGGLFGVLADSRYRSRDVDAGADEGLAEADGAAVVEGDYRGRSRVGAEEGLCRIGPTTLDVAGLDDVDLVAESVLPHGVLVGAVARGCDGARSAIDGRDVTVAESTRNSVACVTPSSSAARMTSMLFDGTGLPTTMIGSCRFNAVGDEVAIRRACDQRAGPSQS